MDAATPTKKISGVIESYSKKKSAARSATTFDLVKNVYQDAIEYKGIKDGARGILTLLSLICFSLTSFAICRLLPLGGKGKADIFTLVTDIIFISCIATFSLYFILRCLRFELFRPEDEPIIFDRKNKKVCRIFRQVKPGWKGLFKTWPITTAEHDWDLVDAEHHAATNANTSTISRVHSLVFVIRRSATDPTIIDSFTLGSSLELGEVTVPAVYEHIRKFMEENGPHLPNGEAVVRSAKPATFTECMARSGPYGDTLKLWWKHARILTVIAFIFFPITFPIVTMLGIFSWFSYITATPIRWSDQVKAAVGMPIVKQRGEASVPE